MNHNEIKHIIISDSLPVVHSLSSNPWNVYSFASWCCPDGISVSLSQSGDLSVSVMLLPRIVCESAHSFGVECVSLSDSRRKRRFD